MSDRPSPPRVLLRIGEAAEAMGMSVDSFERYVQDEVKLVRLGSMRLVPLSELERFAAENAALTISRKRLAAA